MSEIVSATFSIVTPMFLGDADQKAVDIRPPSIKGALRFWWRALNWGRLVQESSNNEVAALAKLHETEARLFGISAGDKNGGQGIFLLSVLQSKIVAVEQPFKDMDPAQLYLLGMGLGNFKGGNHTTRNALSSGEFTVRLLFRPECMEVDHKSISDALYLFGLLGSLGSRARHGMGSVALTEWAGGQYVVPQNLIEYQSAITGLLGQQTEALPPFTAFSKQTRIDISTQNKDPFKLLTAVGTQQQFYRSFGQNGKVQGKTAEQNFRSDHDLILAATEGEKITKAPLRSVFGLPHNYFFSSTKGKADVDYAPEGASGRRASPLLLHIHVLPDGQFVAVQSLLPARFLPKNAQIRIKSKVSSNVPATVDYEIIHNYLNRFEQKVTIYGAK